MNKKETNKYLRDQAETLINKMIEWLSHNVYYEENKDKKLYVLEITTKKGITEYIPFYSLNTLTHIITLINNPLKTYEIKTEKKPEWILLAERKKWLKPKRAKIMLSIHTK